MQLTDKHREYWNRNLRLTAVLLGIWFVVTFVILFMGWILFAIVNAIMIHLRMNELKKKQAL